MIWESRQFWKQSFYEAVQHELHQLYVNSMDEDSKRGNETLQRRPRRSSSIVGRSSEGIGRKLHAVSSSTVLKLVAKRVSNFTFN